MWLLCTDIQVNKKLMLPVPYIAHSLPMLMLKLTFHGRHCSANKCKVCRSCMNFKVRKALVQYNMPTFFHTNSPTQFH